MPAKQAILEFGLRANVRSEGLGPPHFRVGPVKLALLAFALRANARSGGGDARSVEPLRWGAKRREPVTRGVMTANAVCCTLPYAVFFSSRIELLCVTGLNHSLSQ